MPFLAFREGRTGRQMKSDLEGLKAVRPSHNLYIIFKKYAAVL